MTLSLYNPLTTGSGLIVDATTADSTDINPHLLGIQTAFDAVVDLVASSLLTLALGQQYVGTSASSVAIGTGNSTFTIIEANRAWIAGTPLRFANTAAPASQFMRGIVSSYNPTTGVLVAAIFGFTGTGTVATWSISVESVQEDFDFSQLAVKANFAVSQLLGGM